MTTTEITTEQITEYLEHHLAEKAAGSPFEDEEIAHLVELLPETERKAVAQELHDRGLPYTRLIADIR